MHAGDPKKGHSQIGPMQGYIVPIFAGKRGTIIQEGDGTDHFVENTPRRDDLKKADRSSDVESHIFLV